MMKKILPIGSAAIALMSGPAFAQETTDKATSYDSGEIVVTAQKRAQNLQDVPISMQVVDAKSLRENAIRDLYTIAEKVPNFQFNQTTVTPQLYIRGFGSAASNLGFEQSVSLYVDGIYNGRGEQLNIPLYDLERVEILRGPQGALLGKNTAAGAVSVITAKPTSTLQMGIDALYNFNRNGVDIGGFVSGPLSEKVEARIAAKYINLDGFVRNTATGKDDPRSRVFSTRASLRLIPSDSLELLATGQIDRMRTYGSSLVSTAPNATVLPRQVNSAPPFGVPVGSRQNGENAVLTANLDLGFATLSSITGYNHFTYQHATPGGFVTPEPFLASYDEDFDQFSQELRLTSPTGGRLEYIAGLYFDTSSWWLSNASQYAIGALVGTVRGDYNQDAKTYSAYVQSTLHLNDQFRLLGSLRYTHTRKGGDYELVTVAGIPIAPPVRVDRQHIRESRVDPSLTAQYDVNDDVMLYATYAQGSKAGGFASQTRTVTASTFQFGGEKSRSFELGLKSRLFDRRVTLDLALFDTRVTDQQVSIFVPALNTFVNQNAASATSRGAELTFEVRPVDGFRITATGAYVDATYDDYPGAACTVISPTGCTPATNNLKGFELIGSSKWSGTLEAGYQAQVSDALRISMSGGFDFRSGYYIATDYSPVYGRQEAYQKVNARIELASTDDRWSLALLGRNLTNKTTANFAYLYPLASPAVAVHGLAEPRSISLQASVRY